MRQLDILPKVLFIISLMILALFYGLLASKKGWFPSGQMDLALNQAEPLKRAMKASNVYTAPPDNMNPKVYDRWGANILIPDNLQPGNTLITSLWDWNKTGELDVGAKLIDKKGRSVHEWQLDRSELFPNLTNFIWRNPRKTDFQGSYLFPNGDLLLSLEYIGTIRVDACGDILWRLPEFTHHSIHRAEDGTFWMPATYGKKRTGSKRYPNGFPGLDGKPVWVDRILHVTENGKIIDDINVLDVLYLNGLERHIPKSLGGFRPTPEKVKDDMTHINDVEPLRSSMADEYPLFNAGDLVVSSRALHLVFVFDPETLEVKWHASEPFIYQHDPDFIGDGRIGVFNNNFDLGGRTRGKMLGGSQIVVLKPHTGEKKILFPTEYSEPFYTHIRGKWQMLDNGNMLLTEEEASRVVEVTPDGRTVWEWIHRPFSDSRVVPKVSKATRYDLTKKDVASWDCSLIQSFKNFNK